MRGLYIASILITVLLILYRVKANNKRFQALKDDLDTLEIQNKDLQINYDKLKTKLDTAMTTAKKEYEQFTKKHMIVVNSADPVVTVDLPYKLKNVIHVELINAIVPKSQYRINSFNNTFSVDADDFAIQTGSYSDLISLTMTLNQRMYEDGKNVIFLFDSLNRKIISVANTNVTTLGFGGDTSMSDALGYENREYIVADETFTPDPNVIFSSLNFLSDLKTKANLNNRAINNVPASTYTFTDQFFDGTNINIDPTWRYVASAKRVNLKHQLYVDIDVDQVQYWDGSHRLARVFIPESTDEAEYTAYGNPIRRSLIDDNKNLDRFTFRLYAVVDENKRYPYELNGLNYSLHVEITTVDRLLLRS